MAMPALAESSSRRVCGPLSHVRIWPLVLQAGTEGRTYLLGTSLRAAEASHERPLLNARQNMNMYIRNLTDQRPVY